MGRVSAGQAYAAISRIIGAQLEAGSDQLPPISDLARRCGCALGTAVAAIRRLKNEGCVAPVRRCGTKILMAPQASTAAPVPGSPRHSLSQRMLDDVLCGRFDSSAGSLPPAKQLMDHYGAGRVRISRTLAALARQGWLEPDGRTVRCRRTGTSSGVLSLHMLIVGDNQGEIGSFAPHRVPLVRALEEQCRVRGLRFRPHVVARGLGYPKLLSADIKRLSTVAGDRAAAGFIISLAGMSILLIRQIRDVLAATHAPVALLDDTTGLPPSELDALPVQWRRFSITRSDLCGYTAGRFLLQRGHRHVVFAFSEPLSEISWARNRFHGLRRAFADAGLPDAVSLAAPQPPMGALPAPPRLARDVQAMLAAQAGNAYIPRAGTQAHLLLTAQIADLMILHHGRHAARLRMKPLLDKAMAAGGATAVVAASDTTAVVCLDLLRGRGIDVPGRVSVLSFDNSELALERWISSYDFNTAGTAALLVNSLVEPYDKRRRHGRTGPVELEGYVVERATTGSV